MDVATIRGLLFVMVMCGSVRGRSHNSLVTKTLIPCYVPSRVIPPYSVTGCPSLHSSSSFQMRVLPILLSRLRVWWVGQALGQPKLALIPPLLGSLLKYVVCGPWTCSTNETLFNITRSIADPWRSQLQPPMTPLTCIALTGPALP